MPSRGFIVLSRIVVYLIRSNKPTNKFVSPNTSESFAMSKSSHSYETTPPCSSINQDHIQSGFDRRYNLNPSVQYKGARLPYT